MSVPANIRVNASAPFPAKVRAAAPVTVSRSAGIYTLALSIDMLAAVAAGADPTTIKVLVYNTVTKVWQSMTLAALVAGTLTTRVVTAAMSPYAPAASDSVLLVDTTGGAVEIDLTLAALRVGFPLTIKDYLGNAAANNITIKPSGAELVDSYTNAAPLVLKADYDGVKLLPATARYVILP
ncbi:hypothetical protein ACRAVF_27315 [Bradyrhizobium oligotrophicum S58]